LNPSFGYQAVHVIVTASQCAVEIQVRTPLQDLWAQVVEGIADRFGRGIRYGSWDTLPTAFEGLRSAMERTSELFSNLERSQHALRLVGGLNEDQRSALLADNDVASTLTRAEKYVEANREPMDRVAEALKHLAVTVKELEMD
jgi:hypothetical protein